VKVRQAIVRDKLGPPKSRRSRRDVPISDSLVLKLRRARRDSEWPGAEHPVFPSLCGSPLQADNLRRRALKPTAEEAGVPWISFHTLRHTCASLLFAEGRNAVQVQRWLGHHSAAFTLATYIHLLDGDLGEPLIVSTDPSNGANAPRIGHPSTEERAQDNGRTGQSPWSLAQE
jgi:integrase